MDRVKEEVVATREADEKDMYWKKCIKLLTLILPYLTLYHRDDLHFSSKGAKRDGEEPASRPHPHFSPPFPLFDTNYGRAARMG